VVRGALALVATCAIFGAVSPAVALGDVSPEATLADRYSPVVRLVAQTEECGAGEPYTPIDVDAVLGNDQVALRGPWQESNLVGVDVDRRVRLARAALLGLGDEADDRRVAVGERRLR